MRHHLMLKAAARGKYAQLFRHLSSLDVSRWQTARRAAEASVAAAQSALP